MKITEIPGPIWDSFAMINCYPRQWSVEVIKQIKFFRKFSKAMASEYPFGIF
jgi:hypothetical protein